MTNFVKYAVDNGGLIRPLFVPSELTNGTGLTNPSVYNDNGQIMTSLRHLNYTFYHSEGKIFRHQFGAVAYVHPEDDLHLKTINYHLELDDNLYLMRYNKVDMSKVETHQPLWQFWGLEDARLVRWDGKLYYSGVRRDTTNNGQGRIELTEIVIDDYSVSGISRYRIPVPNGDSTYCEKNWMPVIDMPYHFVKWTSPTEVVRYDIETNITEIVATGKKTDLKIDQRGSSQVIPYGKYRLAITHESQLFTDDNSNRDAKYRHRFIVWDKDWNIVKYSEEFDFMTEHVAFCAGMCEKDGNLFISFGFQDNTAFILKVPEKAVTDFIWKNS